MWCQCLTKKCFVVLLLSFKYKTLLKSGIKKRSSPITHDDIYLSSPATIENLRATSVCLVLHSSDSRTHRCEKNKSDKNLPGLLS